MNTHGIYFEYYKWSSFGQYVFTVFPPHVLGYNFIGTKRHNCSWSKQYLYIRFSTFTREWDSLTSFCVTVWIIKNSHIILSWWKHFHTIYLIFFQQGIWVLFSKNTLHVFEVIHNCDHIAEPDSVYFQYILFSFANISVFWYNDTN